MLRFSFPSERKKINAMASKDSYLTAKISIMLGILQGIDPTLPRYLAQ